METIYLDNAATAKPSGSVITAIRPYIENEWHNPSAKYSKGFNIKQKIESVRAGIANEINVNTNEVYFTSGATESNNWAIQGFAGQCKTENKKPLIITTNIEHNSINKCTDAVCRLYGAECIHIPVNKDGLFNIELLKSVLNKSKFPYIKILVSVGMGNNEIGTIQDIASIADTVHAYGSILHTDATQCFGHIPVDNQILCADMISASAHKLGGLKGTGFLYKKDTVKIQPLIYGSQEQGQRGGTENVTGIIALGEAVKQIDYSRAEKVKCHRDYMMKKLTVKFGCKINGIVTNRLPNNINATFPQTVTGEALIYMLDKCNIYISSGSACNTYQSSPSHVLQAIGLNSYEISRTIRITLPDGITARQIDSVVDGIGKQIHILTL